MIAPARLAARRPSIAAVALVTALSMMPTATVLAQAPSADPSAAPDGAALNTDDSLDGTWTVDPTIGSFDYGAGDFSGSWVGYRVQEELVGIGGSEAVGRTPEITGTITLAGTTLSAAEMMADLTTLRSDQSMRDGQLGRQGIQTDQFPTATFVLTEPIELGTLPTEQESIAVTAVGDLTLHGVTNSVSIPLVAVRSGDVIGVAGSLTFSWDDFGMEQPSSMRVVSLANDVTMELQVFLRHDTAAHAAEPSSSPAA